MKEKQQRKKKDKECRSKMVSFRADEMTLFILKKVSNKGRLINNLLKQWWRHDRPSDLLDEDAPTEENDLEEYMT